MILHVAIIMYYVLMFTRIKQLIINGLVFKNGDIGIVFVETIITYDYKILFIYL